MMGCEGSPVAVAASIGRVILHRCGRAGKANVLDEGANPTNHPQQTGYVSASMTDYLNSIRYSSRSVILSASTYK